MYVYSRLMSLPVCVAFDHLHVVQSPDKLGPVETYLRFQDAVRATQSLVFTGKPVPDASSGAKAPFTIFGQDFPKQLISAMGMQTAGYRRGPDATTIALRSNHPTGTGATFIVSSPHSEPSKKESVHPMLAGDNFQSFLAHHGGRQGVYALGFSTDDRSLSQIVANYKKHHPELIASENSEPQVLVTEKGAVKVFEVFAYPNEEKTGPDEGTKLRFIVRDPGTEDEILPGLPKQDMVFPEGQQAMTSDHWVSNVFDRDAVLDVLHETLGFNIKVEFEAGVVQAGKAAIISTVSGNQTQMFSSAGEAEFSPVQVYLPVNQAKTPFGHVPWFVEQMGQGIQHMATRVKDVITFIDNANTMRDVTGEGFNFLSIPRTYYGMLDAASLPGDEAKQTAIQAALKKSGHIDDLNVVHLEITDEEIAAALSEPNYDGPQLTAQDLSEAQTTIKRARYQNLYNLIGDTLSEGEYVQVIRNNILVDTHDGDLLLQIFTDRIAMHPEHSESGPTAKPTDEGPFLEFVSRKCKLRDEGVKPGCGGFGIRNFITLFLSIELNKALLAIDKATAELQAAEPGSKPAKELEETIRFQTQVVTLYREQMNQSQPVLTRIAETATDLAQATDQNRAEKEQAHKDAEQSLKDMTEHYSKEMVKAETAHTQLLAAC